MGMQKVGVLVLSARHGAVYVDTLAVSPSYRRLGIGLRMLRWIEGVCRQMGEEWLEIATLKTNVPALRLYMRFGFCVFAEKKRSVILRKKVAIQ
jgi:ribosomal protein S18 acetylase RimI-like enzyme